jgi:hypothetical protein
MRRQVPRAGLPIFTARKWTRPGIETIICRCFDARRHTAAFRSRDTTWRECVGREYIAVPGLTQSRESIQCGKECTKCLNSVRIGPPQPKNSFLSASSLYPATIRIDNFPNLNASERQETRHFPEAKIAYSVRCAL